MTGNKIGLSSAVAAAVLAVLVVVQQRSLATLRGENQGLRRQLEQMGALRAENERLAKSAAEGGNHASLAQSQLRDLARLRAEVARVREQGRAMSNELARLHGQSGAVTTDAARLGGQSGNVTTTANTDAGQIQVRTVTAVAPAAADSVEGQLQSGGKRWEQSEDQIQAGGYVQDILEGRLNQPEGRGLVGKVVDMEADAQGRTFAHVDFGRGFVVSISTTELSPVRVVP